MSSALKYYPEKPKSGECQNAYTILCRCHDTTNSFLETFVAVRTARGASGTPTDEEQDLLRACLVFAGAGLDSMAKQLVRDALPAVIDRNVGAHAMLKQHISRSVLRKMGDGEIETLADALADPQPRVRLIDHLVRALTSGSLQSADEFLKVAAYFDIPTPSLVPKVEALKAIFSARNEIIHEMDVDFDQPNRNRRPRSKKFITESTSELFRVGGALLAQVDQRASV